MYCLPVFLFMVALSTLVAGQIQRLRCDDSRQVCFTFHYIPLDHISAADYCRQHHVNGRLVKIPDEHTQRWLDDSFRYLSNITEHWVGAKMEKLDNWTWVNGSPYTEMKRIKFPVSQLDVSGYASIKKVPQGTTDAPYMLQMNIIPSNEPTVYRLGLCKTAGSSDSSGSKRFFELPPPPQTKRWYEARARCSSLSSGADLAVLSDDDFPRLEHGHYEYFIGLSNVRLVQDLPGSYYTNWRFTGEPAGVGNNGCVYSTRYYHSQTLYVWNWFTSNCGTPRPFVCQHDLGFVETTTTSKHLNVPRTPATRDETTHQASPASAAAAPSPSSSSSTATQESAPYITMAALAVLIVVAVVVIIGAMRYYHNKSAHGSQQAFNNNMYQMETSTDQPVPKRVHPSIGNHSNDHGDKRYANVVEIQKRKRKQKPTTSFESHQVSPDDDASGAGGAVYASIVSAADVEPRQIRSTEDRPYEKLTKPIVYASLDFN